jgi:threonine dehydrogenase-like Zn-dependent dehydrogenase
MTEVSRIGLSVPAHIGVLVGLSTGAYALTLAAVTAFQSSAETASRAERAPTIAAVGEMAAAHDGLQERLDQARAAYEAAAGAYSSAGLEVAGLEAKLAELAAAVTEVSGTASSLPSSVRLPRVAGTVTTVKAPVTQATTSASGG